MRRRLGGITASLLVLGLLAGCSTEGDFPPRQLPPAPANSIFVSRGDTLNSLAEQYHVSTQELISLNGLAPPYTLHPGQRLTLPAARTYQVKAGDTVYGIARQLNVDMAEIIRLNGLQQPYMLRVGQNLQLPAGGAASPAPAQVASAPVPAPARKPDMPPATSSAPPARATRPSVEATPLDPPAAPAINKPAPASPAPVATANNRPSASGTAPVPGKRGVEAESLAPPPGSGTGTASAANGNGNGGAVPVVPAARQPAPLAPPPAPSEQTLPPAAGNTAQVATAAAPSLAKPDEAPPPRTAARFMWPLRGEILSTYGAKPGGLRNDGINIAASQGTAVAAAESGIVAYAGNELKSFGNLVLIRHDGGWVTVYAHLADIGVQQGQRVTRGQPIGTVGQTGNVRSPQLHFAVRKGDQVVDPMGQLEK
jgi:murein DD-endopeptidase MepM/ murein hydrolase activator NlpD